MARCERPMSAVPGQLPNALAGMGVAARSCGPASSAADEGAVFELDAGGEPSAVKAAGNANPAAQHGPQLAHVAAAAGAVPGPVAVTDDAAAAPAAHARDLQTAADCKAYLRSLPGGEVALEQAAAVTASLNARHDVLHQEELTYLLQAWHASISTQLHKAVGAHAEATTGQCASIELAVESCLAAAVRRRVTDILWQQHAAADRLLLNTARGLADGSSTFLPRSSSMAEANALAETESALPGGRPQPEVLAMCGVAAPLRHLDLTVPAEALSRLDDVDCPIEGITCLQRVTDTLVAEAHRCQSSAGSGDPISSDDLLPLLIATLIQAQLPHLYSCLQYLANFHSSGDWNGAAGFQLATLEAAITFLQQQTPQEGSTPQARTNVPDDSDDSAPTPGKASGLKRQNTGQRRLLAALDSEAPLSFAQTSPSRPAKSRQRQRQRVRAIWPPKACECHSCLPEVTQKSVAAMVQLWESGRTAAPPACHSPLPTSASIVMALSELEEVTNSKRAAQQQWPVPLATAASNPILAAPAFKTTPAGIAPGSAQPAKAPLVVQMEPLPTPSAMPPLLRACSTPSPILSQLIQSSGSSDSLATVSTEQPASASITPLASPTKSAQPPEARAEALRPGLSPATALAMLPRAPSASLQRVAPLVTSPVSTQGAAAAASPPEKPEATVEGVGIAVLLSPQLHAPPGSGSGCGVLPARRPAHALRASARPCPIPRRRNVSPARLLDFDAAADAPKGIQACSRVDVSNGAAARMAHISLLQSVWQDPGLTSRATAALPAAKPPQPQALPFQPGSKPSQRAGLSPLMAASLAEEAAAASQAAALRYRTLGRKKHSHSSAGGPWQPSIVRLRQALFQDENTGQLTASGGSKHGRRIKDALGSDAPLRAPLQMLQRNRRADMSVTAAQRNLLPIRRDWTPEVDPLFAEVWPPMVTAQASSPLISATQAHVSVLESAGSTVSTESPAAGCKLAAADQGLHALILQDYF